VRCPLTIDEVVDPLFEVLSSDRRLLSCLRVQGSRSSGVCCLAREQDQCHKEAREQVYGPPTGAASIMQHDHAIRDHFRPFMALSKSTGAPYPSASFRSRNAAMLHPMGVVNRWGAVT